MSRDGVEREPKDGESYDKSGDIRPVPPGVSNTPDGTERCNVCGGDEVDHHLCVEIESVLGGDVWIYDDGFAHVVPWFTRHDRLGGDRDV